MLDFVKMGQKIWSEFNKENRGVTESFTIFWIFWDLEEFPWFLQIFDHAFYTIYYKLNQNKNTYRNFPFTREPFWSLGSESSRVIIPWNQGILSCAVVAMSFSSWGLWLMMACSRAAPCIHVWSMSSHLQYVGQVRYVIT